MLSLDGLEMKRSSTATIRPITRVPPEQIRQYQRPQPARNFSAKSAGKLPMVEIEPLDFGTTEQTAEAAPTEHTHTDSTVHSSQYEVHPKPEQKVLKQRQYFTHSAKNSVATTTTEIVSQIPPVEKTASGGTELKQKRRWSLFGKRRSAAVSVH
jgi:hypothetical protein